MDLTNFNPADFTDTKKFDALPAGWYRAQIVDSKWLETKAGTGHYMELEWLILGVVQNEKNEEGLKYQGSRVWERLNLVNPKEAAVSIAKRSLARAMTAIGIERCKTEKCLIGGECLIRLKYVPENVQFEAKNEVHGYRKIKASNGSIPASPSGMSEIQGHTGSPAITATAEQKPWERAQQAQQKPLLTQESVYAPF